MSMKHILTWAMLLTALMISGCSPSVGGKGEIQFKEIFESRSSRNHILIEDTYELDVDGDELGEWIVLYRFDPTQNQPQRGAGKWSNTPIQAMVYDAIPCDPPLLYNWYLPAPDNDYLGEGNSRDDEDIIVFTDDWLKGNSQVATEELIINGPGPVNTFSIYSFRHNQKHKDGCQKPSHDSEGFELQGFFRSNGPISWTPADDENNIPFTITTYERTSYERSQLAIRSKYTPIFDTVKDHETFIVNGRTKNPDEQSIDFLYGQPESPQDSPYPEKAVAAFYLSVGVGDQKDNERAHQFLVGEPELTNFESAPGWGLDLPPSEIDHVLIYSISYTPDVEKERAHETREVTVVIKPISKDPNQLLAPRSVTLQVLGVPIGEGRNADCEWRLQEVSNVEVTPGLGMLTR